MVTKCGVFSFIRLKKNNFTITKYDSKKIISATYIEASRVTVLSARRHKYKFNQLKNKNMETLIYHSENFTALNS